MTEQTKLKLNKIIAKLKLNKIIEKLKKELDNEFPARHWNHLNVYMGFWNLVDNIFKN